MAENQKIKPMEHELKKRLGEKMNETFKLDWYFSGWEKPVLFVLVCLGVWKAINLIIGLIN